MSESDIIGSDREQFDFTFFDLLKLSSETKQWWLQPTRSLLHNSISCIISMRIPFQKSKEIRQKIYNSIGKEGKIEITKENFTFKDKTLLEYGLSKDQIRIIKEILSIVNKKSENKEQLITESCLATSGRDKSNKLDLLTIKDLTKIKGIGVWTIKAVKILMNEDPDVSLEQDYYVRKILSRLYGYQKVITETEARKILQTWNGNRSQISYFLWRLKETAIEKILENQKLERHDFLGFEKEERKEREESVRR
jgi:3-methyladenine DNA glycosylase/8-oxoguanine DNA glycosylase